MIALNTLLQNTFNRSSSRVCTVLVFASLLSVSGPALAQDQDAGEKKDTSREEMVAAKKKRSAVMGKRRNMRNKQVRAQVVREMKEAEEEFMKAVAKRAKIKGLKMEGKWPNGRGYRLIDFDENDQPVYFQEENVNAGITTAADQVRGNSAYNGVTGSGVRIGLWEATGIPMVSHREYETSANDDESRVTIMDGTTVVSGHATHVAGTLIARGRDSRLLGMAPEAIISAYRVDNEISEMLGNGADSADSDDIFLSNHSYGVGQGWEFNSSGWTYSGTFSDDDDPTNDFEPDFGRYAGGSVLWDDVTHALPYYTVFVSAGNQRNDDPSNGDPWTRGGQTFTYDSDVHPAGDGDYKNGWDNMEGRKLAKNVITVGNVEDAVSNGNRDVSRAITVSSSSRGPVDDGRIKPDIMGNGSSVRSAGTNSDTSTSVRTGTSMSTPNVCGSSALLIDYYSSLFPQEAMRSSTLKALILHTADDDGNPGPDYRYGWGIMNTEAAADVITLHEENDGEATMMEETVDDQTTSRQHTLIWDGTSPLRVTLCWTDPAGRSRSGHDNRDQALVNDLNLTVTGPDGTHFPYVMPFVGDWSVSSIDDDAVTGVNNVDTVEQVFLEDPTPGLYTVTVDYAGSLEDDTQDYSLIVTGQSSVELTALEIWRFENFGNETGTGNRADNADFDNDGLSNLLEFGLGTSPTEPNVLPVTITDKGSAPTLLVDISANTSDSVDSIAGNFKEFDPAVNLRAEVNDLAADGAVTGVGITADVDINGTAFATSNETLSRNDEPILDGYIFASGNADPSVAVTGLTGISAGDRVTLTVFAIGDNDAQVAPVVLNVDGEVLTSSSATSAASPTKAFTFTATSDITSFDFFADNSEAGNNFAGINGFSVTTVPVEGLSSGFEVNYTRSVEAMELFDFEVMWSNDLDSDSWNTANITEEVVSDNGVIQQVVATDVSTTTEGRRFYRVQMTAK